MMEDYPALFSEFRTVHDSYATDPEKWKSDFNRIGGQVKEVIHDYERRLCGKTESGQFSKFSGGLSEKFWNELRVLFPKIDYIGVL